MKYKKLGIGDIAHDLNISVTTVSFILNGKAKEKRISDELTDRVLKYVKKVNYTPNLLAQSLRTGKTNLIGLIVEDISNPFFANIAKLIEENAYKKGFRIIYCSSENDTDKTRELIKVFRERQVDGYIITPSAGTAIDIKCLLQENANVVLFDRYFPNLLTNYVVVDNAGGTYIAIKHLIEQGYKKIGFITIASEQTQMVERLKGYKKAMDENGKKYVIKKVRFHEDNEKITQQIINFLKSKPEIDALFFATNYLGISGLGALKILKYNLFKDFGVISFDDHDLFKLYTPSITVVAQPIEEISQNIITILFDQLISDDKSEIKQVILPTVFRIRESSIKTI